MDKIVDKILYEKYRPKKIDDLILSDDNKEVLDDLFKNTKQLPSMVFYSVSPGTGKTSLAYIIKEKLNCDILEINASKDTSVDVIRKQVNKFCIQSSSNPDVQKMIFFDEGEKLSSAAQAALKNMMETYNKNVFFIFSTNNIAKIDNAIQSRCVKLDFSTPSKTDIVNRLTEICKKENLELTEEQIKELVNLNYPDMRIMLNTIQSGKIINNDEVFKELHIGIRNGDFDLLNERINSGLDVRLFINWYMNYLWKNWKRLGKNNLDLARKRAFKIAKSLANIEMALNLNVNIAPIFISNCMEIYFVLKGEN